MSSQVMDPLQPSTGLFPEAVVEERPRSFSSWSKDSLQLVLNSAPSAYLGPRRRTQDEEICLDRETTLISHVQPSAELEKPIKDICETPSQDNKQLAVAQSARDAEAFFKAIVGEGPCVFVCSGSAKRCRVTQVHIKDDDDDVVIMTKMRNAWAKSALQLPFRRVTRVDEVTVRFSGVNPKGGSDAFIGTYELVDLNQLRSTLGKEQDRVADGIDVCHVEAGDECEEDYHAGQWYHSSQCPSNIDLWSDCPQQMYERIERRLRSLSILPMLTSAFQTPSLASGQDLFGGLIHATGSHHPTSGICSYREILQQTYGSKRIGDIGVVGYRVLEEWDMRGSAAIPLVTTLILLSCFLFRIIFGDWQTALGASSLAAAVVAMAVQWAIYAADKDSV